MAERIMECGSAPFGDGLGLIVVINLYKRIILIELISKQRCDVGKWYELETETMRNPILMKEVKTLQSVLN